MHYLDHWGFTLTLTLTLRVKLNASGQDACAVHTQLHDPVSIGTMAALLQYFLVSETKWKFNFDLVAESMKTCRSTASKGDAFGGGSRWV